MNSYRGRHETTEKPKDGKDIALARHVRANQDVPRSQLEGKVYKCLKVLYLQFTNDQRLHRSAPFKWLSVPPAPSPNVSILISFFLFSYRGYELQRSTV